ncbi:hypothetical protein, partial [Burkholderia vietnamiensis]
LLSCLASDSRRRADNALFNRLAHKNADRFHRCTMRYIAPFSMPVEAHPDMLTASINNTTQLIMFRTIPFSFVQTSIYDTDWDATSFGGGEH